MSVAIRIRQYAQTPLRIHLFDFRREHGPGFTYSNSDAVLRMNGMAERLSAFDETPDHFVAWLKDRGAEQTGIVGSDVGCEYALRKTYGQYLKDILCASLSPTECGAEIGICRHEVTDIAVDDARYKIMLAGGPPMLVDAVILAMGYLAPHRLTSTQWLNAIESAWDIDAIRRIPSGSRIAIVGTGQTMMDVIVLLRENNHRGAIYAISRRGLIAHPHAIRESVYPLNSDDLPSDLNGLVHFVREAARMWVLAGNDWRAVMNSLRPYTQKLWMGLSLKEQRRFLEHVLPFWRIHRTRVPPGVWEGVTALRLAEQLRVWAGRILSIERQADNFRVVVQRRGTERPTPLEIDYVINCTGPSMDYSTATSALIRNLINRGTIDCHPSGVGLNVTPHGAVISRSGVVDRGMFVVGPACGGTLFEINVIREIRRQAANIAMSLVDHLCLASPPD